MILRCDHDHADEIHNVINDGARLYRGVIPEDCWSEPYLAREELDGDLAEGVGFRGWLGEGRLDGVVGAQQIDGVTLVRHAYVRRDRHRRGIGGRLLRHLLAETVAPVLIGLYADAGWARRFYEQHGFRRVPLEQEPILQRHYWPRVAERVFRASVVLADPRWFAWGPQPNPG